MLLPRTTEPNTLTQPAPTMPPPVSGVQPPLPPNAILTSTGSSSPPPKKPIFKILLFVLLLFILVGGVAVALYLTSQEQEVRQKASQPDNYSQEPFTFQDVKPPSSTVTHRFIPEGSNTDITEVFGNFTFPSHPSCDANSSCTAPVKFEITQIVSQNNLSLVCTTNTANLVHYKFLTNTNPPYPNNLTHNTPDGNANCNRPLSQCDNDPQCTRSEVIRLYGPSGCGDECRVFQATLPFSITNTEYGCGCVQFDPNISTLSVNCRPADEPTAEMTTYTFTRDTAYNNDEGPWAYGYNTAQCAGPTSAPTASPTVTSAPTPTTPPTATATPPGTRNTPTPTPTRTTTPVPTATPAPFGEMCVSISSNPSQPTYNDTVVFTCGAVSGITNYQFRYKPPGSTQYQTLATAQSNQSESLRVNLTGQYVVQCRICPPATSQYQYCNDPNWGWDSTQTTN